MKILVLGTSNSLLRGGWVQGLRDSLPDSEVENRSFGASPGVQFAASLNDDFSLYDLVFLDSVPNDEEFESGKGYSDLVAYSNESFVDEIMFQIAATIASKTRLMIIGIPTRPHYQGSSSVYRRREALAGHIGCQFIDFAKIIADYAEARALDSYQLYGEHPAHPKTFIAYRVGLFLGEYLRTLLRSIPDAFLQQDFRSNFFLKSFDKKDEKPGLTIKTYQNSVAEASAAVFYAGETIKPARSDFFVGFYVNTMDTHCAVRLRGNKELTIASYYPNFPRRLQKIFVPIPDGIVLGEIEILRESDNYDIRALISAPSANSECSPQLAVISMVWWSGQKFYETKLAKDNLANHSGIVTSALLEMFRHWIRHNGDLPYLFLKIPSQLSFLSNPAIGRAIMRTHHNSLVCFDLTSGMLCHTRDERFFSSTRHLPVYIYLARGKVSFALKFNGGEVQLSLESDSRFVVLGVDPTAPPAEFEMVGDQDRTFHLRWGSQFLFADPAGQLVCDRLEPRPMTKFSIIWDTNSRGSDHNQ